jgi:hypothetical protein
MKFVYTKNECEMHFSEEEIKNLERNGKIVFEYENIRHLVNSLARIVSDIHMKFKKDSPELSNLQTREQNNINTK